MAVQLNESLEVGIFDQDGTLYPSSGELGSRLSQLTREWLLEVIHPRIVSFDDFRRQNPNFAEALARHGIQLQDWQREVCDRLAGDIASLVEPRRALVEFLEKIAKRRFVVTLSSEAFSKALIEALGLTNTFEAVINAREINKGTAYRSIRELTDASPCAIGVFGDNRQVDLQPGAELGFRTFYVNPSQDITDQYLI
ncbi:HAD family hydrolase [Candidatus Peregrinibacteria bacterium]|nr:HAD family hydrolase [Candidatus Peregrinibacteria bacterium]